MKKELNLLFVFFFILSSIVTASDLSKNNAYTKVDPPFSYREAKRLNKAIPNKFQVDFENFYVQAEQPFLKACEIWSSIIKTSEIIRIRAIWSDTLDDGLFAACTNNFYNASSSTGKFKAGYQYPMALAEAIIGADLNNNDYEMIIEVNKKYQDTLSYSLDGQLVQNKADFITIIMHEIGHGLGIAGSMNVVNNNGMYGLISWPVNVNNTYPTIWDDFGIVGRQRTTLYTLLSYSNNTPELGSLLQCDSIYFNGVNAYWANLDKTPKLFAPRVWKLGSSLSHLDDSTFLPGNSNSLMTPMLDRAEVIHSPGEVGIAILEDLGWETERFATVYSPKANSSFNRGQTLQINWTDSKSGNIKLILFERYGVDSYYEKRTLTTRLSSTGQNSFSWIVESDISDGNYKVVIKDSDPAKDIIYGESCVFTISDKEQVKAPKITPVSQTYATKNSIPINISCETQGANIYYTLDGAVPSKASTQFTGTSFSIVPPAVVIAKAFKDNYIESDTAKAVYNYAEKIVLNPVFSHPDGTYLTDVLITISCPTPDATIYLSYNYDPQQPVDPPIPGPNYRQDYWSSNESSHGVVTPLNGYTVIRIIAIKQGWQSSAVVKRTYYRKEGVLIQQVDENLTPFDSAAYCGYSVSPWTYVKHNKRADIPKGAEWYFKASQNFKSQSSQKFYNWRVGQTAPKDDKINHTNISIINENENIYANFIPSSDAEICNAAEGTTTVIGGNISFKDPWRYDTLDGARGLRSRGMRSEYITSTSPLKYYTSNQNYKGVFKDQLPNSGTFYQVKALPLLSNINGKDYYFLNWSTNTSEAQLQSPNSLETPVVFKSAGAKVYANYKGHLLSDNITATSNNNQRKIAYADGVSHAVYTSMGSIWYTRNDGSGWSKEIEIDKNGKNPSIHAINGVVCIVWETITAEVGLRKVKYTQSIDNGLHWWDILYIDSFPASIDATPVAAGDFNRTTDLVKQRIVIVWRKTDGLYMFIGPELKYDNSQISNIRYVQGTDSRTSLPSLASDPISYSLVYSHADLIYHLEFKVDVDQNTYNQVGRGTYLVSTYNAGTAANICPSVARHYFSTTGESVIGIAWRGLQDGYTKICYQYCKIHTNNFRSWGMNIMKFESSGYSLDKPSVGFDESSQKSIVLWECNGKICKSERGISEIDNALWSAAQELDSGSEPNLTPNVSGSLPPSSMYLTGSAAPYNIKITKFQTIPATTLQSNTVLDGLFTLTGELTVPVGKVLAIKAGTVMNFQNGSSLVVKGILNVLGEANNKVTFNFQQQNSGLENGIKINDLMANVNIGNAIINNAYYGVYTTGCNNVSIHNSNISDCYIGIYSRDGRIYQGSTTIRNNRISNCRLAAVTLWEASANILNNDLSNNPAGVGLWTGSNSIARLGDQNLAGNNFLTNNIDGLNSYFSAFTYMGGSSFGGYNKIQGNYRWNVLYCSGSTVYAENNWWGTNVKTVIESKLRCPDWGQIDFEPFLDNEPSIQFSQEMIAGSMNEGEKTYSLDKGTGVNISNTGSTVYNSQSDYDSTWSLKDKIHYINSLIGQKQHFNTKKICKELLREYADSSQVIFVLNFLLEASKEDDMDSFKDFLKVLKKAKKKSKLYKYVEILLADLDKDNRLKLYEELSNDKSDTTITQLVRSKIFFYYLNEMNNREKAHDIWNELMKQFPGNESIIALAGFLGPEYYLDKRTGLNQNNGKNEVESVIPKEYQLFNCYPNPFNPSTTISYALPKDSRITLEVYNMLGEKITTLVENIKSAGYHEILFDGSNLASGIYIYKLTAHSLENGEMFVKSAKMLMIK